MCVDLIYILLSNIQIFILIFKYLMFIKKIIRDKFSFFLVIFVSFCMTCTCQIPILYLIYICVL